MKPNRVWSTALAALVILFLLFLMWVRNNTEKHNTSGSSAPNANSEPTKPRPATEAESRENAVAIVRGVFSAPIEFYGRVVDQYRQPVSDAEVDFEAADQFLASGTRYSAKSDSDGNFSITGIQGAGLSVSVSKAGYGRISDVSSQTFGYGMGPDSFRKVPPKKSEPAIFVLRKMAAPEPLATFRRDVLLPKDGTPVEVSLKTGKPVVGGEGDMKFECWTDDRNMDAKEHYEWHARISVPGGGMLARTSPEFDFEAPEDGYKQSIELRMSQTAVEWSDDHDEQYWVKLGNGTYARMRLRLTTGGHHFVSLTTFLNPSGSRNLEYDPKKEIRVH